MNSYMLNVRGPILLRIAIASSLDLAHPVICIIIVAKNYGISWTTGWEDIICGFYTGEAEMNYVHWKRLVVHEIW